LTLRIQRQERNAREREARTAALYGMSRDLTAASSESDAATVLAKHAASVFECGTTVLLAATGSAALRQVAEIGVSGAYDAAAEGVARWVLEHARPAGLGTDTLPGARVVCFPLRSGATVLGVLMLSPRERRGLHVEDEDLLEAFAQQAALA